MPRPPRKTPKSVRSKRRARKAPAKKARRRAGLSKALVVRQQNLGQNTFNKVVVPPFRADSRAKFIKAIAVPSKYNTTLSYTLQSPTQLSGFQADPTSSYIAGQEDLKKMAETIQGIIGPNTGGTSDLVPPARFLLQKSKSNFDFNNRMNAPVSLKIYIVTPKRDTWFAADSSYGMKYTTPAGVSYTWNGTPESAFQVGIYAAQGGSTGSAYLVPGIRLTDSPLFNAYFRIDKSIEVEMGIGGTHSFDLHHTYDQVMDASVYSNNPLRAVKGTTTYVVFMAEGLPCQDQGNSTITTAPVSIGIVETIQYTYTQAWNPIQAFTQDGTLSNDARGNIEVINPGTGTVETIVVA